MMLCEFEKCTGCAACRNICPYNAIAMKEDLWGFLYPEIDIDLCIHCGKCERVCPEILHIPKKIPNMVYAGFARENAIHNESTSGGVATALASYIIKKGGVVFGHGFDHNLNLDCILVDKISELNKIQGTKYVESHMNDVYRLIKEQLKKREIVLFIGTPCQVAGVLNFFGTSEKKLITASFVCGGVPSQKFFRDYVSTLNLDKINNIKFREGKIYSFRAYKDSSLQYSVERWRSEYFIAFDEHISQRESCYHCQYATEGRIGDFTIGDFWGLNKTKIREKNKNMGVSLILPTTSKGEKLLLDCISENILFIEKHTYAEAKKENPRLICPVSKKDEVNQFRKMYLKFGFLKTVNILYGRKYRIYYVKSKLKKITVFDKIYHRIRKNNERDS